MLARVSAIMGHMQGNKRDLPFVDEESIAELGESSPSSCIFGNRRVKSLEDSLRLKSPECFQGSKPIHSASPTCAVAA